MPEGLSGWRTLCHRLVLHRWAVRGRKVVEILPSHRTSASNACASVSWQRWARCSRSGWPAVSPPGGLQSAGHRRCATGVLNWSQNRFQIHPDLSQKANLKNQALYALPLSLSLPRSQGITREPAPKVLLSVSCWPILVDFFAFPTALEK